MPVYRTCQTCGRTFSLKPSRAAYRPGMFCSWACRFPDLDIPPVERITALIDRSGNGCHEWTGARDREGYGHTPGIRLFGTTFAHRIVYILAHYPTQDPTTNPFPHLRVCHHCDNPPCCRIDHLFKGTDADNLADMRAKGRGYSPFPARRGEANHRTTLTVTKVLEIRGKYQPGRVTLKQLAAEYGVTFSSIHNIVTRRTWKHV